MHKLRQRFLRPLAMLIPAALCAAGAQADDYDTEVRETYLNAILNQHSAAEVAKDRHSCITGVQSDAVVMSRELGLPGFPDAADLCVTVLIRTGRDRRLLDEYRTLLAANGGDPSSVGSFPEAVGGALLKQKSSDVPIGNGLAVGIKPSLAFDAGFVVAYRTDDRDMSGLPKAEQLKATAEACLAQRASDMTQCFWAGYALGARALNGLLPPIRS